MRRSRKSPEIFSMSALDLFASAVGAFVLIAIVLLPYYRNLIPTLAQVDVLEDQVSQLISQADIADARAKAAEDTAEQLNRELSDAQAQSASLQAQLAQAQQAAQQAQQQAQSLSSQNQDLQGRNTRLAGQNSTLQQQLEKAQGDVAELRSRPEPQALLGIATKAESFVVVVDLSGSILRFTDIVEETLLRLFDDFSPGVRVEVIGYRRRQGAQPSVVRWQGATGPAPLTPRNAQALTQFIRNDMLASIQPQDDTPTFYALQQAFDYDTESVILVTDGDPTDLEIPALIRAVNRLQAETGSDTELHTVAIGNFRENKAFTNFLTTLATQNNGRFIGISK